MEVFYSGFFRQSGVIPFSIKKVLFLILCAIRFLIYQAKWLIKLYIIETCDRISFREKGSPYTPDVLYKDNFFLFREGHLIFHRNLNVLTA